MNAMDKREELQAALEYAEGANDTEAIIQIQREILALDAHDRNVSGGAGWAGLDSVQMS